ncbi:MAG TPA: DUF2721 domain-containing protein [Steroidobacteraceae bacterium]
METQDQLIRVLQTAISPAVMISGVGLLVLSLTNRFARVTDRVRSLVSQRRSADQIQHAGLSVQIRILYRRSRILMFATTLALGSALFTALLIALLFVDYAASVSLLMLLFTGSLASLVASLVLFIRDMTLSLRALHEEMGLPPGGSAHPQQTPPRLE